MNLKLHRLEISNFKGIAHKVIEFDGNTLIKGQNGSGKSSVGSTLGWIIADTDIELNKGPMVTPLGMSEVVTKVTADLLVDGKPLQIAKIQKYKEKTDDDGKVSSNVTNSYEINSVPKVQRDFLADLQQRGINTEDFMVLTNPNQFTADTSKKGREQMREILFKMADEFTDTDIAKEVKANEVVALLEDGYRLDEIEASAKASIKKIVDINGKNNEIIDGRIQGILDSKSTADIKELEKTKAEYESELEEIRATATDIIGADNKVKGKIAELEGKLIEIESEERDKLYESINKTVSKLNEAESKANEKKADSIRLKCDLDSIYQEREAIKESLENYRALYKKVQDEVFDENDTVCPACGRPFPEDEISVMRKRHEDGKTQRMADYKKKGETFAKQLEKLDAKYKATEAELDKADKAWKTADSKVDKLREENESIPRNPNLSENKNYIETQEKIKELREQLKTKGDFKLQELSNRENYLNQMIKQVVGEIAVVERNKELDNQVAQLRGEKKNGEITKAKNERILAQVDAVKRCKDDKLADSINKKFSLVTWKFYEYQRNGDRKEICEPYIDNKPMSSCANGSLRTIAKISICANIQRDMGFSYPIIVDDYTLFSSNSTERLNVGESQLIGLVVTEDKELKIEKGE